jgi:DNA-binding NarL/FixJ family response regulator
MEIQAGGTAWARFSEFGDMMDDLTHPAELLDGSQKSPVQKSPVIVMIDHNVLARTCMLTILKRELDGFDIVEMANTRDLSWLSGRDVRLIALNIADKPITDPSIEDHLAIIAGHYPNAYVALLSNRDDEATAAAAMQRGIRGFLPTSIAVEVAVAGLRLVLAGGAYRPLPIIRQSEAVNPKSASDDAGNPERSTHSANGQDDNGDNGNGAVEMVRERTLVELTPREQQVLAALNLGLPNKLIAVRLNLSENTVKMHIQHIMRKCSARNRTEAVLRWSRRFNGHTSSSPVPSSS